MTTSHRFSSPLRYPGGKGALADFFKRLIQVNDLIDGEYVEPFAGGAGVAWHLLFGEYVKSVYINDVDKSIYAFWHSAIYETDNLCKQIRDRRVSMAEWRRQKAVQDNPNEYSLLELGFSTFFLNRTNRSGIISGGVIGGQGQSGKWKLNARFNKVDLINRIERIAKYKNRIHLSQLDGRDFLRQLKSTLSRRSLIYMDPPYYKKGQVLYMNHLEHPDHDEIAKLVQSEIFVPWIVSYDVVKEILELYKFRNRIRYRLNYRAHDRHKGSEVMFFSDNLIPPDESKLYRTRMPNMVSAI